ncbi:Gfo/Idh/MocA family protein [Phytoactinopolyspora mesophila]|uniref:Gfo/Idh/MocA family protein n=1 Tax=Phytoactinopolyspora mesophila TaxID=2650750 RepID=UPI0013917F09|nr:Gfo/Idh/MocA family oxidoreductase [Phytoactinopolyspora mesophila]
MLRLGLVGTDCPHADYYVRYLNVDKAYEGFRFVAIAGGQTQRNIELAELGGVEEIVDDVSALIDRVDVAVVGHMHGGLHRQSAVPLLTAGKHVYIEKPLAVTVADAEAIIEAARQADVVVGSSSGMRFSPLVDKLRDSASRLGELQVLSVGGPTNPELPYGGHIFYGCHTVEFAMEVLGNPEFSNDVHVEQANHDITVIGRTETKPPIRLIMSLVKIDEGAEEMWGAMMIGSGGIVASEVGDPSDHYFPVTRGLAKFLDAVNMNAQQTPYGQLVAPVKLFENISKAQLAT